MLREVLKTQGSKGALAFLAQMQSGEERASAEARVHDARKKSAMDALLSPPSADTHGRDTGQLLSRPRRAVQRAQATRLGRNSGGDRDKIR